MTKDQLIHFLATRKAQKLIQSATWGDLTAVVTTLTQDEKDLIAKGIATGSYSELANITKTMRDTFRSQAETEATTALSDDNLTLAELDSLL